MAVIKKLFRCIPTILVIGFLTFSLFFPAGNKFDTAKKISLTLGFALLALGLFLFSALCKWCIRRRKRILSARQNSASESEKALAKISDSLQRDSKLQRSFWASPQNVSVESQSGSYRNNDFWLRLFLMLYVIWTVISFFLSETANFGFTEVLMLCSCALLFVTNRKIFRGKALYIFGNLILIFSALWGYVLYLSSHHDRLFGLFYDPQFKTDAWPNAFALFILLLWPLFFHTFWKGKKLQVLKILGLSVIFSAFVLTFSRAGLVVLVVQAGFLALYGLICFIKSKKKIIPWSKIVQLAGAIILSLALIVAAQYLRSHYFQKNTVSFADKAEFANGEDVTSVQERLDFWKGGFVLTMQKPLFGYGPFSFGYVYRSIQQDWLAISDHPHNIFLKVSAESGIPAGIFLLIFLVLVFKKVFANFTQLDAEKKLLLFLLCVAFLGALAHNLVDYNLNFATNIVIFWLFLMFIDELATENFSNGGKNFRKNLGSDHVGAVSSPSGGRGIGMDTGAPKKFLVSGISLILFLLTASLSGYQLFNEFSRIMVGRTGVNDAKSYFSVYGTSLFSRYALLDQGAWADHLGNQPLAEQYYLLYVKENPWDAFGFERLGQFYEQQNDLSNALINFSKAVQLDPKNNWNYYLDKLRVLVRLDKKEEILALSQKIQTELNQYLPKVKGNLHYTAQSANAKDAVQILEILKQYDSENRPILEQDEEVISQNIAKYGG